MANEEWGPLAGLIGEWEGQGGLDYSFHHAEEAVGDTTYLEKVSFKPFGPVVNGAQTLFGLDYKTAMWRGDETDPFHTEIGYWLWDAATGEGSYLHAHASSVSYEVTVRVGDGEWSYEEMSMLKMDEFPDLFPHSDRCTLRKVA